MSCFQFVVHKFSELLHTIKTSTHGHGCSQKLTRQSKFMNNDYIQYPLKRPLKTPESISASRSTVGNTNSAFTMFWFCTNCTSFYISSSQKLFPFFHQNLHLNLLRCRCRKYQAFFGLNNCLGKLVQTAIIKLFSVR